MLIQAANRRLESSATYLTFLIDAELSELPKGEWLTIVRALARATNDMVP